MLRYIGLYHTLIVLLVAMMVNSCSNADEPSGKEDSEDTPLMVSAQSESSFSRALLPAGMYDNFKVYAVAEKDASQIEIMKSYKVQFVTDRWTYLIGDQALAFWIGSVDRYLFAAGAPYDKVTFTDISSMKLHLVNNTTGSVLAAQPKSIERDAPEFGKVVNLHFGYSHCRVCVAFVKNSATDTSVTNIKMTPVAAITSEADMTYTYDWSAVTAATSLNATASSSDSFIYNDVTIPAGTADAVVSSTYYYCVPDATNPVNWTASCTCNGEDRAATFVNTMTWESGKSYTYIFSLEGKSPKLVYVTSQDLTFYCDDIIPGGVFSDSDMTE